MFNQAIAALGHSIARKQTHSRSNAKSNHHVNIHSPSFLLFVDYTFFVQQKLVAATTTTAPWALEGPGSTGCLIIGGL
jgi:hypothetical protein